MTKVAPNSSSPNRQGRREPAGYSSCCWRPRPARSSIRTVQRSSIAAAPTAVRWRSWVHGLPDSLPMQRLASGDAWALRIELPPGSRIEYKLEIVQDGRVEWILDPLNPVRRHRSVRRELRLSGLRLRATALDAAGSGREAGHVDEIVVESRALRRRARSHRSLRAGAVRARHAAIRCSSLHDGFDYLRYASLQVVLDNLIHRLEIPPLIAVLTQSDDRLREYGGDDRHAEFVAQGATRCARATFRPAATTRGGRVLMGASFGAVASLHAAWRHPAAFRPAAAAVRLVCVRRIVHASAEPDVRLRGALREPLRAAPGRPADRIYVTCGIYESLIYENRDLCRVLRQHSPERALRGGTRRPPLGELARPAAERADLAVPGPSSLGAIVTALCATTQICEPDRRPGARCSAGPPGELP